MQGWVCLRMGKVALDVCVDVAVHTQVGGGHPWSPHHHAWRAPLRDPVDGRKPQAWVELISLPTPWSSWEMTHGSNE